MQAVVKYGCGDGELDLREVSVPEIGPDDLLVEVKTAGICGSDVGMYHASRFTRPMVLGHEFAGVVAQVGYRVTDWKVGDRIVSDNTGYACGKCYACATGQFLECEQRIGIGYGYDGGFAKYVKIPGQILKLHPGATFHIPEALSFEAAALLDPCCNAYHSLIQKSSFQAGDDVVIYGPGTIGLFCIQIAKASGANKIIVMGTKRHEGERFQLAKELGATHTVVSSDPDAIKQVRDILGGEAPRIIIDCAGTPAVTKQSILLAACGGEIVKIGFDRAPLDFSLDALVGKAVKLIGNMGFNTISWRNCIRLMESGQVKVDQIITHRLPLNEYQKGFDLLLERQAIKVMLEP